GSQGPKEDRGAALQTARAGAGRHARRRRLRGRERTRAMARLLRGGLTPRARPCASLAPPGPRAIASRDVRVSTKEDDMTTHEKVQAMVDDLRALRLQALRADVA